MNSKISNDLFAVCDWKKFTIILSTIDNCDCYDAFTTVERNKRNILLLNQYFCKCWS